MIDFSSVRINRDTKKSNINIEEIDNKKIAIVGIGLKLPKAKSVNEFWSNIAGGEDCVRELSDKRKNMALNMLKAIGIEEETVRFEEAAFIEDIDKFDYAYFNISPKEASIMDPNQRLFLETAIQAIEDAGYGGNKLKGTRTGVYLGYGSETDYKNYISKVEPESLIYSIPGNIRPIIAGRLSYIMDFRGPCMLVDTTCSSSLVAMHLACKAIREGECDSAIVGGIQLHILPYRTAKIGIEASNGRAKTFDDSSDGTGTGEGAVVMMLKPLRAAIEAKDNIYAVIRGSAVNHDGSSIGLTAPNAIAQEDVILRAWEDAEVEADSISYIEAHGTGTKLGDPIEIDGICRAFLMHTNRKSFCGIGSLKSNIGHLDNTAGIAGLLKGTLALKNKQIPPTLHFQRPNRNINFEDSPLYIADQLSEWEAKNTVRRCGVSSFGLSGTNCHMVLEEWVDKKEPPISGQEVNYLFTVSARSLESFKLLIDKYKDYLLSKSSLNPMSLSYTACTGRGHYEYRLAIIYSSLSDLLEKLKDFSALYQSSEKSGIFYGDNSNAPRNKMGEHQEKINGTDMEAIERQAANLTEEYLQSGREEEISYLRELSKLYVDGGYINFEAVFQGKKTRKISLPVYPFRKTRCWVDFSDSKVADYKEKNLYTMRWILHNSDSNREVRDGGLALVIVHGNGHEDRMLEELTNQNISAIKIRLGREYCEKSENEYEVSNGIEDFSRVLEKLKDKHLKYIIFLSDMKKTEKTLYLTDFDEQFNYEVMSAFYLTKALLNSEIAYPLDMVFLSDNVNAVNGQEDILNPLSNSLFGLGKVIEAEYPNITCRAIDMDCKTPWRTVVREIRKSKSCYLTAFRGEQKYQEELGRISPDQVTEGKLNIKDDNVYVITGGAGGIGLKIARFLSSKAKVKIILINRSVMPPKNEWADIAKDNSDLSRARKVRELLEIEKNGSQVFCLKGDVSEEDEISQCIYIVRAKFGKINGIIHAAGVEGNGFLISREEKNFRSVLAPKVKGTWLLDRLTAEDKLDFFVVFSSVNTLMGIPGQGDYTAANSYLDAFSAYRNKKGKTTLAINWAPWEEAGMAKDNNSDFKNGIFKALKTREAIDLFEKALYSDMTRIIVGEINKGGSMYGKSIEDIDFMIQDEVKSEFSKDTKKVLKKKMAEERSVIDIGQIDYPQVERTITEIWKKVLGFEEIDIEENFFQIGGDSIMINRVYSLINDAFPQSISMPELFKYTTILSISKHIYQNSISVLTDNKVPEKETSSETQKDMKDRISQMLEEAKKQNLPLESVMQKYFSMED